MLENTQFWDELAVQSYKTILKSNPDNALVHKNLGLAYARQGKINKAARAMQKAIKADKECLEAYYHLGTFYRELGKETEAKRAFNNYNKRAAAFNHESAVVSGLLNSLKSKD